jgi:hypothetical protein
MPDLSAQHLLQRIRLDGRGLVRGDGDLVRIGGLGHAGDQALALRGLVHDLTRDGWLAPAGPQQWRLTERAVAWLEAAPD